MMPIVEEIIQLVDKCVALEAQEGVYCPDHDWSFEYDEDGDIAVRLHGYAVAYIGQAGNVTEVISLDWNGGTEFVEALRRIVAMTEETRAVLAGQLKLI